MDPELVKELARALEEARAALREGEEASRVTESAQYEARKDLGTGPPLGAGTVSIPEMVKRVELARSVMEVMWTSHALQADRLNAAAAALRRAHQVMTAPRLTPAQETEGFVKLLDNGESILLSPAQADRVRKMRPALRPDFSMTIYHPHGTPAVEVATQLPMGAWYRLPHAEVIEGGPFAGLTNQEVAKLTPDQRESMVAAANSDILPKRVRQFLTRHGMKVLAAAAAGPFFVAAQTYLAWERKLMQAYATRPATGAPPAAVRQAPGAGQGTK